MMLLKLAWRNIWRNRRRSLIILTSVVIGLVFIVFIEGVLRGFLQQAFVNQLGGHTAHVQIHSAGFRDNPGVERFMMAPEAAAKAIESDARVAASSRRVLVFGLLSSARNSSGITLVGIEPEKESRVTTIAGSVIEGRYFTGGPREILISERLAGILDVRLGEKVVAMASARGGSVGSDLFRVVGLYRTPVSAFDRMHAYIPIATAQELLQTGNGVAEFAMVLGSKDDASAVRDSLRSVLGASYEVHSYEDIIPTLVMQMEVAEQSMLIYYFIIGIAMIFGIINTMMMSVYERIHEFGVLKAIGMFDQKLFSMVLLEAGFLGMVGTITGLGLGVALTSYFASNGLNFAWFAEGLSSWGTGAVIYPIIKPSSLFAGGLLILFLCVLAAVFPAIRAVRLQPIAAIRHV